MLKKIKSKLGFIYRGLIGIKDNFIDNPKVNVEMFGKNIFSIGKTVNGEDIKCYKFGEGKEKILYFGGLHGNEVGTVKLMKKWINCLNKKVVNAGLLSLKNKQIFVIPCLNIDGYKKALKNPKYFLGGRFGKTNSNNVDLNRNFPTKNWSKDTTLFAAGKYFEVSGGEKAGGEPEIQALLNLVENEKIKTIYVYHNCWGTVMSNFTESSEIKTKDYVKNSSYRYYSKKEWDNLRDGQKTGHGTIWGIESNIDFIEIETKTRWGSEWKSNKKALINSLKQKKY